MSLDSAIPLFEMRCPCCGKTAQVKVRGLDSFMSKCVHCKKQLAVQPSVEEKPNNILISLAVIAVDFPVKKPAGKKLEKVA